ncbi:hypothetical protein QWY84_07855 [Aquisalimonas lutea]|uniref:hypothetical protein n=1 Tax=Aquisalimonas lutea TaxID=1327750 RepID=UPI0025B43200|nr:hypothetical protein [Aquisalimonas lutea]MDN3517518.1 hypothetical protein [Aquisalimonas lutea]
MKKVLAGIFGFIATAVVAQESQWPPLPEDGFISGRAAEQQDLEAGNAVFVAAVDGVSIGEPIDIIIPQYAFHIEQDEKPPSLLFRLNRRRG